MKQLFTLLCVLSIFLLQLYGHVLPDKTQIDDALIQQRNVEESGRVIYYFSSPVEIPSILGKIAVTQVAYHKDTTIAYVIMGNEQKVTIGDSVLIPHMISFDVSDNRYTVTQCHLQQRSPIETKVGILMADEKDIVYFNPDRTIKSVYISSNRPRELRMKDSTIKVTSTVVVDDKITTNKPGITLTLTEPGMIATPVGALLFSKAYFTSDGVFRSGELANPQKITTTAGVVLGTFLDINPDGVILSVYLFGTQAMTTTWGERMLYERVYFNPQGRLESGRFAEAFTIETPVGTITAKGYFKVENDTSILTLAESQNITTPAGVMRVKNSIMFSNEKLSHCEPENNVDITTLYGTFTHEGGKTLGFSHDGTVVYFTPVRDITIKTPIGQCTVEPSWDGIRFFASGNLKSCTIKNPLSAKNNTNSFVCHGSTSFYENGSVESTNLPKAMVIRSPAGNVSVDGFVEFLQNGLLKSGRLFAGATIAGKFYRKRAMLYFDDNGKIQQGPPEGH